jgi:signal transduction histidine kinase
LAVGQVAEVDEQATDLVTTVAERLSAHIENLRLLEETRNRRYELEERSRELEASQRVTFAASETGNPDELLDLVVNLIRDQFDLYHAQVYLVDEERQAAVLRKSTGYAGRQLLEGGHYIPLEQPTLVTQAVHQGEPAVVADLCQDQSWRPDPLLPHTRSQLVVPLKAGDKVIGALDVYSRTPGRFTPASVALFQTMAEQVAMSFDNSALLTRTAQQAEALTQHTIQLRAAADVAQRLNAILDPDQLLPEVVDLLQSRFGLYHAHIYMLEADSASSSHEGEGRTGRLVVRAGSGEVGRVLRERGHSISLEAPKSLVARAARTREAVLLDDTSLVSDFMPNPLLPQTRSEVAVPLLAGDQILGVLDVQDDEAGRFGPSDLDVFTTLAGQIATALQNARLYDETQRTAERLREVDRLKGEFLATMSHELRTPLNSILGYSEFLLVDLAEELEPESFEDLQSIHDNSRHLLHLINDILDLTKIEAGRLTLNFEDVEIAPLLDEVKVNNAGLLVTKPVEMTVEVESGLPAVRADRVRLSQIMNNLVSNAVKFTEQGQVRLRAFQEDGRVCLEVQDTGVGIKPGDLDDIFEKFRQVDGSFTRRAQGTGLGLAITRHLVEMHGGNIDVRSQPGQGSTFTVRLPIDRPEAEAATVRNGNLNE